MVCGVLREVQEVQKGLRSTKETRRGRAARKRKSKDEAGKHTTHVAMLLAGDARHARDSLREVAEGVIPWQSATARIDFLGSESFLQPANKVLHNTLVELVKDVRGDGVVDVGVRKRLPEGVMERLDSCLTTGSSEFAWTLIGSRKRVKDLAKVAKRTRRVDIVTDLIAWNRALRALACLATGDENLLWIIANIDSKDRVATAYNAIAAGDLDPFETSRYQGCGDTCHAGVEQVCESASPCRLRLDMLESGGWKVGEEDLTAASGLAADILRKVADGHVDGICTLVSEEGELCLIRRDDDRNDCCARLLLLKLSLGTGINNVFATHIMKAMTHLCGPPPLSRVHVEVHPFLLRRVRVVLFGD